MRKFRELMRLKYELGRSHREIAASLGIANSTVSDYAGRARAAGDMTPDPGHPTIVTIDLRAWCCSG